MFKVENQKCQKHQKNVNVLMPGTKRVKGSRPLKINVKGTIYQKWVFSQYFSHFLTYLAKKKSGPKTTIWTLFRPRKQLLAIF